ncbi:hypothetical protein SAMN05192558_109342 [Actinokineospora alba]|uniref:Uncharacterized protein n=1 Tax=Actinokineospora alba TaxID=504798 RepID=A0A1H0TA73_9PSEU|nr:hypothetical protein [Actinokineospora alba]TDP66298.1 hypothetical protein C8E96_1798 [Actinokineospora alba]SDJ21321.1 hypothetical protein SAMN05421871_11133 [Actinokineospora alba]SDP50600.1 hypothetical protein SAMN05192558_109342 [Actinokineospora alba]
MSDSQRTLILHLASGGEPVVFTLSPKSVKSLKPRLPVLMASGGVDTLELEDGNAVAVNFGHVVTAHLDELPSHVRAYGSPNRKGSGFGV